MQPTQSAYKTQFANLDASGHGQENREARWNASHFQQFSLIALQSRFFPRLVESFCIAPVHQISIIFASIYYFHSFSFSGHLSTPKISGGNCIKCSLHTECSKPVKNCIWSTKINIMVLQGFLKVL